MDTLRSAPAVAMQTMTDLAAKAQRVLSSLDKMQAEFSADQVSDAFRKEVLELKAAVASAQPVASLATVPATAAERAEEAAPVDIAVEEVDDNMDEGPPPHRRGSARSTCRCSDVAAESNKFE